MRRNIRAASLSTHHMIGRGCEQKYEVAIITECAQFRSNFELSFAKSWMRNYRLQWLIQETPDKLLVFHVCVCVCT